MHADVDDSNPLRAKEIHTRTVADYAARAADRIEAGIDLLAADAIARQAFGFANRAMYLQRLHTQVAAQRREDPQRDLEDTVAGLDAAAASAGGRSSSPSCC